MSNVINYQWPEYNEKSSSYDLYVDGEKIVVHTTEVADYAIFSIKGNVEVKLKASSELTEHTIKPSRQNVESKTSDNELSFSIDKPCSLLIESADLPDLFIYANPEERNVPDKNDESVVWFEAGQVYDIGVLEIESRQTVYVEGGAVLKGCIHSENSENVSLRGRGIIDASFLESQSRRMILFEKCRNVLIEGVIATGTPSWNTVIGLCEDVHIDNYKTIGWVICSDGIDVAGSKNVLIENCCIRANDDCVVIKSTSKPRIYIEWRGDVKNVIVRDCVFYNAEEGNAMEIGYETSAETIEDIVFDNIDVLAAHAHGGVFTIHNGDRAHIKNVRYENIYVEHYFDRLIDFFIQKSRYSIDNQRGTVSNIHFRNIYCVEDKFNTLSIIGGYDDNHTISDVHFEDFYIGDKKVLCDNDLNLYTRHASNIHYS